MKKFCPTRVTVTLDEPVVVAQAPPDLDRARAGWGRWQFPHISRLADGQLLVRFSIESDSRESRGKPAAHAYSSDNGRTWRLGEPQVGHEVEDGVLLPNGERLKQVKLKSLRAEDFDLPLSVCDYVSARGFPRSLYRVEDLPEDFVGWRFSRLPVGTSHWIEENATVHIPGELRAVTHEKARHTKPPGIGGIGQVREGLIPLPILLGRIRVAPDQSLWAVTWTTRLFDEKPQSAPVFLRSVDIGHTWNMLGEIRYQGDEQADPSAKKRNGFSETDYNFRPDGSVICLMRTSDGNGIGPLYLVRSVDYCRTWSEPKVFDTFGKWPQLLTLQGS